MMTKDEILSNVEMSRRELELARYHLLEASWLKHDSAQSTQLLLAVDSILVSVYTLIHDAE